MSDGLNEIVAVIERSAVVLPKQMSHVLSSKLTLCPCLWPQQQQCLLLELCSCWIRMCWSSSCYQGCL
jgi:hypothetical protein